MKALTLTHTKAALAEYDAWYGPALRAFFLHADTNEKVYAFEAEVERRGRAVGHAFWLDTSDRNSRSTCEGCVRPGDPWLRNLVAKYSG